MKQLEKIRHYNLPEHTNNLYKEEAISSIALTKNVASKINELVDAFNALASEKWEKIQEQDGKIRKAIIYMKDNLLNAIDTLLNSKGEDMIDNSVREYLGSLKSDLDIIESRFNSVLNGVSQDSEVLDARVGFDGTTYQNLGEAIRNQLNTMKFIDSYNYLTDLPDINSATLPKYLLNFSSTDPNLPANLPFEYLPESLILLETFVKRDNILQIITTKGKVYTRYKGAGDWSKWSDGTTSATLIDPNSYKSKLPNINDCKNGSTYILNFANGSTDIPLNLPFSSIPDSLLFLTTFISGSYGYQELKPANNKYLYRRMYAGGWNDWYLVYGNTIEGESVLSINETTGLLKGLKECYSKGYKKLIVEAGEYNIISEYESYYGSDYFTNYVNYSTSDKFDRGLWLEDIEVIFNPGAKVVCNYTGTNTNVKDYFSPFAVGNNVVIDGLILDSSNCRYGIHPDYNTGSTRSYMKIINSDLKHTKSATNSQCIGAGFGIHVDWLIENTIFRNSYNTAVLKVHNNVSQEAQSKLIIKNCYVENKGYFEFNHYSTSTKKSSVIISGCSFVNEPVLDYETSSSKENMELIVFNNEIRS